MRTAPLTLAGCLLAASAASAQEVFGHISLSYAVNVDCRADIDGDGHGDILTGLPLDGCGFEGVYNHGRIRVYSSVTTATLLEVTSMKCGDSFGYAVLALDDIDGDGVPDVLAAGNGDFPYVPKVQAISGATGATIYRVPQPMSSVIDGPPLWACAGHTLLDSVGDVDGDGLSDFAVTTKTGARVCSGRDGSTISEIPTSVTSKSYASSVAGLGDVDLDGIPDVAVSDLVAPIGSASRVLVCSARTGELLFQVSGQPLQPGQAADGFGQCIAAPGDLDAEGHPDLLVSMTNDASPEQHGIVRALSGVDGALILGVLAETFGLEDVIVRRLGDLDADGFPDLMLSVSGSTESRVEVWSAREATKLMTLGPIEAGPQSFGGVLDTIGDLDLDGLPDLLVGDSYDFYLVAGHLDIVPTEVHPTILSLPGGAGERLGASLARLGDVDGDGREDFACGAPGGAGAVRLVSGYHGDTLATFAGGELDADFGAALAVTGDLDGDGVADLLVGAPRADASGTDSGEVRLLSGATGATLWSASAAAAGDRFGTSLAPVGDVDHDGVPDVLVGAPLADAPLPDSGAAWLLDGAGGTVLQSWGGTALEDDFGRGVSGPGDIDGDGTPDLAIGAPLVNGPGPSTNDGRVLVLSGAAGGVLQSIDPPATYGGFGWSLAAAGDQDGDDVPDLLVGAPALSLLTQLPNGRALLVSGADGSLLLGVGKGVGATKLGRAVATADIDGDGRLDLLAGAPGGSLSSAGAAFSGDNGELLLIAESLVGGESLGTAVCAADVNGDGHQDLVAGAPDAGSGAGRIDVVSIVPQWTSLPGGFAGKPGVAGANGYPLLGGSGTLVPGGEVSVHLGSAAPHAVGRLLAGTEIAFASFKGGVLVPQPIVVLSFLTDGAGQQSWSAAWPAGLPAGSSVYLQAWILDAAAVEGVAGSNGLQGHVP